MPIGHPQRTWQQGLQQPSRPGLAPLNPAAVLFGTLLLLSGCQHWSDQAKEAGTRSPSPAPNQCGVLNPDSPLNPIYLCHQGDLYYWQSPSESRQIEKKFLYQLLAKKVGALEKHLYLAEGSFGQVDLMAVAGPFAAEDWHFEVVGQIGPVAVSLPLPRHFAAWAAAPIRPFVVPQGSSQAVVAGQLQILPRDDVPQSVAYRKLTITSSMKDIRWQEKLGVYRVSVPVGEEIPLAQTLQTDLNRMFARITPVPAVVTRGYALSFGRFSLAKAPVSQNSTKASEQETTAESDGSGPSGEDAVL